MGFWSSWPATICKKPEELDEYRITTIDDAALTKTSAGMRLISIRRSEQEQCGLQCQLRGRFVFTVRSTGTVPSASGVCVNNEAVGHHANDGCAIFEMSCGRGLDAGHAHLVLHSIECKSTTCQSQALYDAMYLHCFADRSVLGGSYVVALFACTGAATKTGWYDRHGDVI